MGCFLSWIEIIFDNEGESAVKIKDISTSIETRPKELLFVIAIIFNCLVGFIDYATGTYVGMEIFYLLPISFVSWFIGRKAGILMSVLSTGTLVTADMFAFRRHEIFWIWNPVVHLGMFVVFAYLISGIKRALTEISEGKNILASILESAGEGIYGIDTKGNHTMVNQAAVQMLGYEVRELIGRHSHSIWHHTRADGTPYPQEQCRIYAALRDGVVKRITDEVFWRKDGNPFPVDYTVAPIWEKGGIIGAVIVFRDITERRRAEEGLIKAMADLARSNSDLEQFAYAISHDLQAPLRSMSGFAQILLENYRGRLDEEADKYVGFIVRSAERMQRMIEDILAYSRAGARTGEFSSVDFEPVLDRAIKNLHASIEESGAVITRGPLPTVKADRSQMVTLFQNLIGNAIKFSSGTPRVHVSAARKGMEWVFSVRDNGIGIDPEQFGRVFILFQRLHTSQEYPGTGIGLAICKKIVERHGGRIWVESEAGQGSTFYFSLPAGN